MKKSTLRIAAVILALAVVAVGVWYFFLRDKGAEPAGSKLIIGTEGNWAPWTYHDPETGNLTGFDVEVARAVAAKLGVEPDFQEVEWTAILAGLETRRYDTAANGFGITEERQKTYNFSDPYAYSITVLVVRDDNTEITSFEDLKGKKTANSASSTYMAMGEKFGASVTAIESLADTMSQVIDGRVDATINALDSFNDYMKEKPGAPLKIVATSDEKTPVGFPFNKSADPELLKRVNAAIAELRADGILKAISEKYFGMDITAE